MTPDDAFPPDEAPTLVRGRLVPFPSIPPPTPRGARLRWIVAVSLAIGLGCVCAALGERLYPLHVRAFAPSIVPTGIAFSRPDATNPAPIETILDAGVDVQSKPKHVIAPKTVPNVPDFGI